MPPTITTFDRADELNFGVQGTRDARSVVYRVYVDPATVDGTLHGSVDDSTVIDHVLTEAPTTYDGLSRNDAATEIDQFAPFRYNVTVKYGIREIRYFEDESVSFQTSLETMRLTRGISQQRFGPNQSADGADIPDHHGFIDVEYTDNGVEVNGHDVEIPIQQFSYTKRTQSATLTEAKRVFLANFTGTLNSVTFQGFDALSVLCTGIELSNTMASEQEIRFNFKMRPNPSLPLTIGGITIPALDSGGSPVLISGWDAIDARWVPQEDGSTNHLTVAAEGLYVTRHYPTADHNQMFVGL